MAFDHDGDGADDDVAMARIKNYMQRHKSRMH